MKISPLFLIAIVLSFVSCKESKQKGSAEVSPDNELVQHSRYYLYFEVPRRFELDPRSHEGEAKWWCKFDDPETGLLVEADSWGYIDVHDLLMTAPEWNDTNHLQLLKQDGRDVEVIVAAEALHKSVEQYFLHKILPEGCEKREFMNYDRYLHRYSNGLTVYFFNKDMSDDTNGRCYEAMRFSCRDGEFDDHLDLAMEILESADPWKER